VIYLQYYSKYIKGTPYKAGILLERIFICKVKEPLRIIMDGHVACPDKKVHLSTKSLKHMHDRHVYEKKTPLDLRIILDNLTNIVKYPDEVRKDKDAKKGDFLFIRKVGEHAYWAAVQVSLEGGIEVVSASATGPRYTEKFTLLWSRGTANSPSSGQAI
jgi:hypothetical protein